MKVGDLLYCNTNLKHLENGTIVLCKNKYYEIIFYNGKDLTLRGEKIDITFKPYKDDIIFKKHIYTPLRMRKIKLKKLNAL